MINKPKEEALGAEDLKLLLDQKEFLEAQLPRLLEVATSEEERQALRTAYAKARDNWNNVVDKTLTPGNATALELVAQLQTAQQDIENSCESLAGVAATIGKITAGVNIANKLVGFFI
jgi:hypothetical protein